MSTDEARAAAAPEPPDSQGATEAPPALSLEIVLRVSDDVVARHIEGEIIIVPLAAGIGDLDDELYTLNSTGQAIWERLDGVRTLGAVALELSRLFAAQPGEVERDVVGLAGELVKRGMLIVV